MSLVCVSGDARIYLAAARQPPGPGIVQKDTALTRPSAASSRGQRPTGHRRNLLLESVNRAPGILTASQRADTD